MMYRPTIKSLRAVAQEPLGLKWREHIVADQAVGQLVRIHRVVAMEHLRLDLGELALSHDARALDHRQKIERRLPAPTSVSRRWPWRASPDSLATTQAAPLHGRTLARPRQAEKSTPIRPTLSIRPYQNRRELSIDDDHTTT